MPEDFKKLFGNFEVPERRKNPRQEELQARYESLNEEERAELMGLNVFPDNPHSAELRKKEALGQITDEEREELRRLYQLKTRQEEKTPAVIQLWERVEANDLNVEQVEMGNGKSIEVTSTEEEKVIWTFGLRGCYGSVVFTENEDGTRNCVLTHYPPTELSQNMVKLGDLIGISEKMKTAKIKKVILALPSEWVQNPETKKYEMKTKNQQAVNALTIAIQAELGADIEIKLELYSENIHVGEKGKSPFPAVTFCAVRCRALRR